MVDEPPPGDERERDLAEAVHDEIGECQPREDPQKRLDDVQRALKSAASWRWGPAPGSAAAASSSFGEIRATACAAARAGRNASVRAISSRRGTASLERITPSAAAAPARTKGNRSSS